MGLGSRAFAESAPTTQQITLRPPRIGVASFHNPSDPSSGVACVAPDRDPILFNRRSELPSDVLWISNAKDGRSQQNFCEPAFLHTNIDHIGRDLGVSFLEVPGLIAIAATVGRVRDLAAYSYPWVDLSRDWKYDRLSIAIAKISPSTGETISDMISPLAQCYQKYSFVIDSVFPEGGNSTVYTLRANRLRYAQYICSTLVPTGAWTPISNVGQRNLGMDYWLNPLNPCIVEASIEFATALDAQVTPDLVAFGSGISRGRQSIRRWISQPELAWLVKYARVNIISAWQCMGGLSPLDERLALPAVLTADPVYSLSIAAGLVCQSHWMGLAEPTTIERPGASATAKRVSKYSPANVWLRAADRAYCFAMAEAVANRGLSVMSYGNGSVSFYGPTNDIAQIADIAEQLGTCHPCLAAIEARAFAAHTA